MGYYNGTANDMTALRSALIAACVADGWAWNGATEELAKGVMFIRVQVLAEHLSFLGRTASGAGAAPNQVKMGRISSAAAFALSYPLTYHIFTFSQEVYVVARYDVDKYIWAAWGQSTVAGLPGTGMWVGAIVADVISNGTAPIGMTAIAGGSISYLCPALMHNDNYSPNQARNCWVHHDLDAYGWRFGVGDGSAPVGIVPAAPLLGILPSIWNSEAVLLPLRSYVARPSSKISMIVDCEHARITRIDNYDPGQIITIGGTRWMIFPWFLKNAAIRIAGLGISHTGTFGWAIRYEGP